MHHPLVDDITLADERLEVPADPGLALVSLTRSENRVEEGADREMLLAPRLPDGARPCTHPGIVFLDARRVGGREDSQAARTTSATEDLKVGVSSEDCPKQVR